MRPALSPRSLGPLTLGLSLGAAACGASHDSGAAGHVSLPQEEYWGGELLSAPAIVSVTFAQDTLGPQLQAFGQSVTSSAWWNTVRAGYCGGDAGCVGDGSQAAAVTVQAAPQASYTDSDQDGQSSLQTWLSSEISSGALPAPSTNPDIVYVVYFPATTTVSFDGAKSCVDGGFDGYHNFMTIGARQIPYAVVVECAPDDAPPDAALPDPLQSTTLTASHEIFEASTDPLPLSGFTLDWNDTANWGWYDIVGGEGADLCVDVFGLGQDETTEGAYTVQRIWSNARAAASLDPCNPAPSGQGYFNVAPQKAFFVLEVGSSLTFQADAFAGASVGDFTLVVQDWSVLTPPPSYLSFSIAGGEETDAGPQIEVHDGSEVQITMTLLADPGALQTSEADGSLVSFTGDPYAPTAAHFWPFAVMTPEDAAQQGVPTDSVYGAARGEAGARGRPRVHRFGAPRRVLR